MSKTDNLEEQAKQDIADSVVSDKKQYFVPKYGVGGIEAETTEEALKLAKKVKKQEGSDAK